MIAAYQTNVCRHPLLPGKPKMRAVPFHHGLSRTYPGQRVSGEGLLKLPLRLRRDLILLFVIKLAMLGLLYLLFFSPSHQPAIDVVAHIAGQPPH
jgi:hypothetical protein